MKWPARPFSRWVVWRLDEASANVRRARPPRAALRAEPRPRAWRGRMTPHQRAGKLSAGCARHPEPASSSEAGTANPERELTRRQIAFIKDDKGVDRGDHGFSEHPSREFFLDIDRAAVNWRADLTARSAGSSPNSASRSRALRCWIFTGSTGWRPRRSGPAGAPARPAERSSISAGPAISSTARCVRDWRSSPIGRSAGPRSRR